MEQVLRVFLIKVNFAYSFIIESFENQMNLNVSGRNNKFKIHL